MYMLPGSEGCNWPPELCSRLQQCGTVCVHGDTFFYKKNIVGHARLACLPGWLKLLQEQLAIVVMHAGSVVCFSWLVATWSGKDCCPASNVHRISEENCYSEYPCSHPRSIPSGTSGALATNVMESAMGVPRSSSARLAVWFALIPR